MNVLQILLVFSFSIILSIVFSTLFIRRTLEYFIKDITYTLMETTTNLYETMNAQFKVLSETILNLYDEVYNDKGSDRIDDNDDRKL